MAGTSNTGGAPTTETHRIIYRIDTGTVVAIETVWAEDDAGADQSETLYRRLNSIMQGFTARTGPLDVLTVQTMPVGPMRVDIATRTLIADQPGIPEELAEAAVI